MEFTGSYVSRNEVVKFLLRAGLASIVTYYSVKWMIAQMDPTSKEKRKQKSLAEKLLQRLNKENDVQISPQQFNDYELMIASHLVVPSDISVKWSDIAGLDGVIDELRETVILPIRHRDCFGRSKLWQAPKGVLLYGPPGCGKTLIAKATAKEAAMRFINLDVAILTDKWYGESQKLASAVFSLAMKIQPCIIFIDEIDSFLRTRNSHDHEATAMMKTQFMMLWDGLSTSPNSTVIVMGATNRPQDLDKAILRRMPTQFHIGLPDEAQRLSILKLILKSEDIDENVDFNKLASMTDAFSGSDLREMCRNASVCRFRQYVRQQSNAADSAMPVEDIPEGAPKLTITMEDFVKACETTKGYKFHSGMASI